MTTKTSSKTNTVTLSVASREDVTKREAARRVGRDVKSVHGDVHALLDAGVLDREENGQIIFPFDAVHVDFTLTAAA